jgi:alpha-1,6-mannosyltransferase
VFILTSNKSLPQDQKTGPIRVSAWPLIALWVIAADMLGLYAWLSCHAYLLNPVWPFIAIYGILFACYAYAAGRIIPRIDPRHARQSLWLIMASGVLFRLVAAPSAPSLSTDIYRYVWDGRLTMHGINPYHWAPNAQALRSLRDPIWNMMDYKAYQTIYMPVSQIVFAAASAIFHNNLVGFKLTFVLFDIGVMSLLQVVLRSLGRSPANVIWYAWCPLPITEVAIAGHQDVVGVFFLLLAMVLIRRREWAWLAAVALVCSGLTKGFAFMLLPLFVRNYGRAFATAALLSLLYLGMPMWVYLPEFLHGMTQYLTNVHVNSGLFNWTNMALWRLTPNHYQIADGLSKLAILCAATWSAWRPIAGYADLLRRSFIVLAVILLVVPTLFPWYLVWVIPFLPLLGKRPSWAFVVLICTVSLIYTYYIFIEPLWWTPVLEYVPVYLILACEYVEWRLRQVRVKS